MTLEMLEKAGVSIQHKNFSDFFIRGNQHFKPLQYQVEGDWSGAAFHMAAAAISGHVCIKGLNPTSAQGDRIICDVLKSAGALVTLSDEAVTVIKSDLHDFHFDATMYPDLFPPLAALAAHCKGTSVITGTQRLTQKESNRALSLQSEFQKLGIQIKLSENEMHITGGKITGGSVNSHNDHRIAMALALMSLNAKMPVEIEHYETVNKSYPDFFSDFNESKH
jgi:3-phosphoshikimate 1-carboxyvinyltransferase